MNWLGEQGYSAKGAKVRQTPRPSRSTSPPLRAPPHPPRSTSPPLRGAPGGRVGGGTRGVAREVFVLSALAPNHTGLTVSDQPSLFWFISNTAPFPVELTVADPQGEKPLLETRISLPSQPGGQRIRLADP